MERGFLRMLCLDCCVGKSGLHQYIFSVDDRGGFLCHLNLFVI